MFKKQHAPRVIVFVVDLMVCALSVFVAYALRFDFQFLDTHYSQSIPWVLLLVLAVRTVSFLVFRTYAGIVRYTTARDAERILYATTLGSFVIYVLAAWLQRFSVLELPRSIILIDYIMTNFAMIGSRVLLKSFYGFISSDAKRTAVAILGSEQEALPVKRALDRDSGADVQIVAILEPSQCRRGTTMEDIPVFPVAELESVLRRGGVEKLILTNDIEDEQLRDWVIDQCIRQRVAILSAPNVRKWIMGDISFQRVKRFDINDLLTRPPIVLSTEAIEANLTDRIVLVTGAAGSIGSEIVRQVTRFNPKLIILFDQAETPLYDLDLELREGMGFTDFHLVIGSITDPHRLREVFREYSPDVVFHAAAYKHVPMMEENPYEAIANNVCGTKYLTDLSVEYGVKRFVMVSTDKAVNPTNVMGASKRICEMYVQAHAANASTRFVTTRFGNVLGSNGSVVQRFRRQIEAGGPVTITHPEIRRYFMTIPEACQLVLEAGAMGQGGEIFVFDMGRAERILDLARKMIMLSGYMPDQDIRIVYVGLRPGEKLYEELLANEENTIPTHHPKILRAKVRECDPVEVRNAINELIAMLPTADDFAIVARMKALVPEFVSRNSRFQALDHA